VPSWVAENIEDSTSEAWNRESNMKSSVDFTVQSSGPNIKENALQGDKHTIATDMFINSATGWQTRESDGRYGKNKYHLASLCTNAKIARPFQSHLPSAMR